MSSSASAPAFILQLKSFCTTLEDNARQLRHAIDHPPASTSRSDSSYADNLVERAELIASRVACAEDELLGSIENRISTVTLEEIALRCKTLYEANENLINAMEGVAPSHVKESRKRISRDGYRNKVSEYEVRVKELLHLQASSDPLHNAVSSVSMEIQHASGWSTELPISTIDPLIATTACSESTSQADILTGHTETKAALTPERDFNAIVEDPRTPNLEKWKLSGATQQLFRSTAPLGRAGRPVAVTASPTTPEMPEISAAVRSVRRQFHGVGVTRQMEREESECDEGMATPKAVVPSRVMDDKSPPTPTLNASPMRTTVLVTNVPQEGTSRSLCLASMKKTRIGHNDPHSPDTPDSRDEIDITNILRDFKPSTPLRQGRILPIAAMDADDDNDDDASQMMASPPRLTKILVPSKCVVADGQGGWIPDISNAEYDQVPSFLRLQVSLESLNSAIGKLNQHIATNASKSNKRLESFTGAELESIVNSSTSETGSSSNVYAMGLVQLNRLDMVTEHSIKAYRVRRFY